MERFHLHKFIEAYQMVAALSQTAFHLGSMNPTTSLALSQEQFCELRSNLTTLIALLNEHGLPMSAMSAEKALELTIGTESIVGNSAD